MVLAQRGLLISGKPSAARACYFFASSITTQWED